MKNYIRSLYKPSLYKLDYPPNKKSIVGTNYIMVSLMENLYKYYKEYSIKMLVENCNSSDPINHTSCIIASPSAYNPNYRFDWIRDSAIFAGMLIDLVQNNILKYNVIDKIVENYVLKNLHYQEMALLRV